MALTIAQAHEGPGKAGIRPLFANSPRPMKVITGTVAFDNSYPTGGEDFSSVLGQFKEVLGVLVESPLGSAGTGKHVVVDKSGQKLLLYTNAATPAEVADTSDQSGATGLDFIAWGY